PSRGSAFGKSLSEVRQKMESELSAYADQVEPTELAQYNLLRAELTDYWQILDPVLRWELPTRQARGYVFLRDDVFPRRQAMLDMAGCIADFNEQQVDLGRLRASDLLSKFRTRLAGTLALALAVGLILAAFSMYTILQLESRAQER